MAAGEHRGNGQEARTGAAGLKDCVVPAKAGTSCNFALRLREAPAFAGAHTGGASLLLQLGEGPLDPRQQARDVFALHRIHLILHIRAESLDKCDFTEPLIQSEAIVLSRNADESNDAPSVQTFLRRLHGVMVARSYVLVDYDIPNDRLDQACAVTPGIESPTVSPLHDCVACPRLWHPIRL